MKIKIVVFFAALSLVLMGCPVSIPSKQILAVPGKSGVVKKGIVGSTKCIGSSMDQKDILNMQKALNINNPTGNPFSWQNPDTNSQYTLIPTITFQNTQEQTCREYTTVGIIDGKREEIHCTACQQPDGSWNIVQ